MTKKESLTTKSTGELDKFLAETRETLRGERFAAAGARAKNPNAPHKLRKAIARVLTEQSTRHASAAVSVSPGSRPPTK